MIRLAKGTALASGICFCAAFFRVSERAGVINVLSSASEHNNNQGGFFKNFRSYAAVTGRSSGGRKNAAASGSTSSHLEEVEHLNERQQTALQEALKQIEKNFGPGSLMWLGRQPSVGTVPVISTSSIALDSALGIGGLPKGRVIEIYGPEASGKTTLALHAIAECQKQNGQCVFVDAEHALDATFASAIGVNIKHLLLSQPDNGEMALGLVDCLVRSGAVDLIVIDSVAALAPRAELEGEMGDAHMALQARLMSQALRKLTSSLSRSQATLIFINQVRSKLSTFGGFGGPQEVTSGGNALKFYASVRLNIKRIAFVKQGERVLGSTVRVKVTKNKLAPPFRTAEFDIEFGKGISKEGELLDLGVEHGIVTKAGAFFSYKGERVGQGREKSKLFLQENKVMADMIRNEIREKLQEQMPEFTLEGSLEEQKGAPREGDENNDEDDDADDREESGVAS